MMLKEMRCSPAIADIDRESASLTSDRSPRCVGVSCSTEVLQENMLIWVLIASFSDWVLKATASHVTSLEWYVNIRTREAYPTW